MAAVTHGKFPKWANENTVLVQIQDTDNDRPEVRPFANVKNRARFLKVHQFRFNDVSDENSPHWDEQDWITDAQAKELAKVVQDCFDAGQNLIVHCHAGLCRSGAVTEVAVMLGFEDVDNNERIPNTLVKSKLRRELGLLQSWEQ